MEYWDLFRKREVQANFNKEEIEAVKKTSVKICACIKDTRNNNEEGIKAFGNPILSLRSLN